MIYVLGGMTTYTTQWRNSYTNIGKSVVAIQLFMNEGLEEDLQLVRNLKQPDFFDKVFPLHVNCLNIDPLQVAYNISIGRGGSKNSFAS